MKPWIALLCLLPSSLAVLWVSVTVIVRRIRRNHR